MSEQNKKNKKNENPPKKKDDLIKAIIQLQKEDSIK